MKLKEIEAFNIDVPNHIVDFIKNLKDKGIATYITGGAVRDTLLNYEFHDIDLFCMCSKEYFKENTKDVDISIDIEFDNVFLTTINELSFSYFQQSISFNQNFEDDFKSRDYTINSFWYDALNKKLYGFEESFQDLESRVLRVCTQDNFRNFLIWLRGARFTSKYRLYNNDIYNFTLNLDDIDTRFKAMRLRNEVSKHSIKTLMDTYQLGGVVDKLREFNLIP